MQEAIPYRTYIQQSPGVRVRDDNGGGSRGQQEVNNNGASNARQMTQENAVIVFSKKGCCMCHVVKRLLLGLGVNPAVFEVDEAQEVAVVDELVKLEGCQDGQIHFPVVFVRGKLFGGLDRVMATHISGELVPILKDAGALWL